MIPLSFLAEFEYCPRSCFWKLTGHAQIGDENKFIADGNAAHRTVDQKYFRSKNSKKIESSVRIFSEKFGISGVIDVLEFLPKNEIIPVEFKRGKIRENKMHETQLALTAVCVREMFPDFVVKKGAIFFAGDRRKKEIVLTDAKISSAENLAREISKKELIPQNFPAKKDARCDGCCFRELCFL